MLYYSSEIYFQCLGHHKLDSNGSDKFVAEQM